MQRAAPSLGCRVSGQPACDDLFTMQPLVRLPFHVIAPH